MKPILLFVEVLNKLQTWTWTLIEGNCRKRGLAAKRENGGRNVYGYISSCSGFASVSLPEIGGHGSMFPYMYIRILTAANVLRALRASRERSACSQQTSEKLSSNWKHALETHG